MTWGKSWIPTRATFAFLSIPLSVLYSRPAVDGGIEERIQTRRRWCHQLWLELGNGFHRLKPSPCQPTLRASSPTSPPRLPPLSYHTSFLQLTPRFCFLLKLPSCIAFKSHLKPFVLRLLLLLSTLYYFFFYSFSSSTNEHPPSSSVSLLYRCVLSPQTSDIS